MLKKIIFNIILLSSYLNVTTANAQSISPKQINSSTSSQKITIDISKPISISSPTQPITVNLPNPIKVNLPNQSTNSTLKDLIGVIIPLIGISSLTWGIISYNQQNKWKKLEFIAGKFKEFEDNPKIKNALLMLDWPSRIIKFDELKNENNKEGYLEFDIKLLEESFQLPSGKWSDENIVIRDCFDELLTALDRFNLYVETKLITKEDLKLYLIYWLQLINNFEGHPNTKSDLFYINLWENFIHRYSYKTTELLEKYKMVPKYKK
jgi:hypothetical protein